MRIQYLVRKLKKKICDKTIRPKLKHKGLKMFQKGAANSVEPGRLRPLSNSEVLSRKDVYRSHSTGSQSKVVGGGGFVQWSWLSGES